DWTGGGTTGIGAFDPATATYYLRGGPSAGGADAGIFQFGGRGWQPALVTPSFPARTRVDTGSVLWGGDFSGDWMSRWQVQKGTSFGEQNLQVVSDPQFGSVLRVSYPAGSASPSSGGPVGGAQFLTTLGLPPRDTL